MLADIGSPEQLRGALTENFAMGGDEFIRNRMAGEKAAAAQAMLAERESMVPYIEEEGRNIRAAEERKNQITLQMLKDYEAYRREGLSEQAAMDRLLQTQDFEGEQSDIDRTREDYQFAKNWNLKKYEIDTQKKNKLLNGLINVLKKRMNELAPT